MFVLVEPLTVPVSVTDCDTMTVSTEGLTVTVTTLEPLLPQPERASRASTPALQLKIANLRNFFTTSTPKVHPPAPTAAELSILLQPAYHPGRCPGTAKLETQCRRSEGAADRKTERRGRFKIIQLAGIVLNQVDLRRHLILENIRIDRIERALQISNLGGLDERRLRSNSLVKPVHVIRIIDAERRLHDGQANHKFNASRAAEAEVGARLD